MILSYLCTPLRYVEYLCCTHDETQNETFDMRKSFRRIYSRIENIRFWYMYTRTKSFRGKSWKYSINFSESIPHLCFHRRVFKLVLFAKGAQERIRGIFIGDASCDTVQVRRKILHIALQRLFSWILRSHAAPGFAVQYISFALSLDYQVGRSNRYSWKPNFLNVVEDSRRKNFI